MSDATPSDGADVRSAHRSEAERTTVRLRACAKASAKRALDVALSATALVVLSPVIVGTAVAVYTSLGRPVLFRQRRPGLHGRPFELVKFRTMRSPRQDENPATTDAVRLTAVGRRLRELSLDELPSLWNVFCGEMSLVGPRPLLMQYLQRYTPQQARRHAVKPGITGWAQINGRNANSWETKLALDVWYVDHQSLLLDVLILARTVRTVLSKSGISYDGAATMPEFTGTHVGSA